MVHYSTQGAIEKCHKMSILISKNLFLIILEAGKCLRIKVLDDLISGNGHLPGL